MFLLLYTIDVRFSTAKIRTYELTAIELRFIPLRNCCNRTLPGNRVIPGNVISYICNASAQLA